jgi:hypothetical protein
MITDKFIAELREAFLVFGVDEDIKPRDATHIEAGDVDVLAMGTTADAVFSIAPRPFGTPSYIDISLPRTAIMAVVEWHLKNPRQAPLPFGTT